MKNQQEVFLRFISRVVEYWDWIKIIFINEYWYAKVFYLLKDAQKDPHQEIEEEKDSQGSGSNYSGTQMNE